MVNIIQRLILVFMLRRGVPVDLIAVLRARGVGARCSRSQHNSARQLMYRLAGRGWVQEEKQDGERTIFFSLTPAGTQIAQKFEAYLAALDSARRKMEGSSGVPVGPAVVIRASSLTRSTSPEVPSRHVFACRNCDAVVTAENLRRQLKRTKKFVCDTCGLAQTEDARDFLEPLAES